MILTNDFEVNAALSDAWPVLIDIPRVARCLPGAELESSDGDLHRGRMSAKIGPISAMYAGTATVLERDDDSHTVVLKLEAREARGQGMANATLTLRLAEVGGGTHVAVETDLRMSGAHAQFGRGILQTVAGKMIGAFAANLEAEISGGDETGAATPRVVPGASTGGAPAGARAATPPLDVASLLPGDASLSGLARLAAPILLGVVGGALWGRRRGGRTVINVHLHLGPVEGSRS